MSPGVRLMTPKGWKQFSLGELLEFKNGVNAGKASYGKGTKFINISEILSNRSLEASKVPGMVEIDDNKKELYGVKHGDILFNRTSEVSNEIAMASVYLDTEKVVFGGFVIRGRPTTDELIPLYSKYCFQSNQFRKQVIQKAQGAIRTNIGQSDLGKIIIDLPEPDEQLVIAKTLSLWDDAIEKNQLLIRNKKIIKRQLIQKFVSSNSLDCEWKEMTVNECCEILDNRRKPLNNQERAKRKGTIPYYGANGLVDTVDEAIFNEEIILVAEDGGPFNEFNTKPVAYRVKHPCWVNNHAHVLKTKEGICIDYIYYALVHKDFRKFIVGGARGKLNKGQLEKVSLSLPVKYKDQKLISMYLDMIEKEIDILSEKLNLLMYQRVGMLQKLVSGKIRVNI